MAVLCSTSGISLTPAGCPFISDQSYGKKLAIHPSIMVQKKQLYGCSKYRIDTPPIRLYPIHRRSYLFIKQVS